MQINSNYAKACTQLCCCADDDSWKTAGGAGCDGLGGLPACIADKTDQDGNGLPDALDNCPVTCGVCGALNTTASDALQVGIRPRLAYLEPGGATWFHFPAVSGTVYQITVGLVDLRDSKLTLYESDKVTQRGFNDDAASGLGSEIIWKDTAALSADMSVEVTAVRRSDGGYFYITVQHTIAETSCDDGEQNAGELGVDCGGPHCAPCRIPLLLTLTVGDGGQFDEQTFQEYQADLLSTLQTNLSLSWVSGVAVKAILPATCSGCVNKLLLAVVVEASPGLVPMICRPDCEAFDKQLATAVHDKSSPLALKHPELVGVQEGTLCSGDPIYPCYYGRCPPQKKSSDARPSGTCLCHPGWSGLGCAIRAVGPPSTPALVSRWGGQQLMVAAGMTAVAVASLIGCFVMYRHTKFERKMYNQSVFEMLQAPDAPAASFQMTSMASPSLKAGAGLNDGQFNSPQAVPPWHD